MRINNIFLSNLPIGQAENRETESAPRAEESTAAKTGLSAHVPSAELTNLLEQVRNTPEMRRELLAEIGRRLAEGYYLTSEAAERAAEAILKAPD
jgi:hypothetical protein